jgi:hypothetical protein
VGGDITIVKYQGQWLLLGLTVDATSGLVRTVDQLSNEDADTLKQWIVPIPEATGHSFWSTMMRMASRSWPMN